MENLKSKLGLRIKYLRKSQNITQEKLAEMCDCSLSYIGFVERGEMALSLYNFFRISNVLKLDINEFLKEFVDK